MSYTNPGVGESASQYSSPPASTVDGGKRTETMVGNVGALANDDYREDGALPAGGPAWGVTDESTEDSAQYGPGVDTQRSSG